MGTTVKVREKYQITIPEDIRDKIPLEVGERIEVDVKDGVIFLRPVIEVPRDQAWFWSRQWQESVGKAKREYKAGKAKVFKSVKEARKHID